MRHATLLLPLAIVVTLAGCTRHAAPPQLPGGAADASAREAAYAASALEHHASFWRQAWKRADGTYNIDGIRASVDAYPASKAARKKARNRGVTVAILGALGGGFVGYAAGQQLFVADDDRLADGTLYTLYGAGAAIALVAVVLDRTWARTAYGEIAPAYNAELRRDLALPPLAR
ncbi:MAG: hypothetical protein F9K40_22630 [Kofleriaceae bacterium]|nr:MAG: hypothetical protein F9K40_22630 [Kofleriaceae bacterium]MBZ0236914.1 hypothetical protein [Kofleriaceae bacterium]